MDSAYYLAENWGESMFPLYLVWVSLMTSPMDFCGMHVCFKTRRLKRTLEVNCVDSLD